MAANAADPGKATPDAGTPAATTPAAGTPAAGTPAPAAADTATPAAGAEGTPAPGAGGKDGAAPPEPKAPITYDLKVPEGADVYIEDSDIESIRTLATAKGWTAEEAQAALDEHADAIAAQSEAFRNETNSDPVYGGANLEQTQLQAKRALARMWPDGSAEAQALGKLLTKTGFGNHRLIVGGLANIGRLMQEDSPGRTGTEGAAKRAPEDVLYGKKAGE